MRRFTDILSLRKEAEGSMQSLPSLMMHAEEIARNVIHGPHDQRKSGAGEKFWQFREYAYGDRPQDIDWRQSAKTQNIFIRQKEWQTTQKTFFWCASGPAMSYASDKKLMRKTDAAYILTLALAILLTRGDEQVGLVGDTKTGRSEKKLEQIGTSLLSQTETNPLAPADHLSIPQRASLVLAGDFLSPLEEIEENFQKLSARTGQALVIQILDPAELKLSFSGRITFQGPQQSEKETINDVASVRAAYIQRIHEHIDGLKAICRAQNWAYILHTTDQDLSRTLSQIWAMLDKSAGSSAS